MNNKKKTDKASFRFTEENLAKAKAIICKYPEGKQMSAVVPLLDLAQRQNNGWLSKDAMEYVADFLNIDYIKLYEITSFYTMFNLKPVGKYHIQVCRTTPCWLRGSDEIMHNCKKIINNESNNVKCKGDLFTISEVECLGACINAPLVKINDDYYENLDSDKICEIIKKLAEDS